MKLFENDNFLRCSTENIVLLRYYDISPRGNIMKQIATIVGIFQIYWVKNFNFHHLEKLQFILQFIGVLIFPKLSINRSHIYIDSIYIDSILTERSIS